MCLSDVHRVLATEAAVSDIVCRCVQRAWTKSVLRDLDTLEDYERLTNQEVSGE